MKMMHELFFALHLLSPSMCVLPSSIISHFLPPECPFHLGEERRKKRADRKTKLKKEQGREERRKCS